MKKLWNYLNLNEDCDFLMIDNAYLNISNKTKEVELAWKILRDEYYHNIYKKYQTIEKVIDAGFLETSSVQDEKLNLLTTPLHKIKKNYNPTMNKPVVLLSTGGFYPLHNGHIDMMESAKNTLQKKGYDVVGGYFSISHDNYVLTKPLYNENKYERIYQLEKMLENNNWLDVEPWESLHNSDVVNFTDVIERLSKYLHKHISKDIEIAYVFGADNAKFMFCFENKGLGVCVSREILIEDFINTKNKIKKDNCFFITNNKKTKYLSSRYFRKNNEKLLNETTNNKSIYVVRDEGILTLNYLNIDKKILKEKQKYFLNCFVEILKEYIKNNIYVLDVVTQLKNAEDKLKNIKTINLDSYFNGTFNINISRLFEISSIQTKYIKLIGTSIDYKKQLNNIPKGHYTLVDDDSVSGNTLRNIIYDLKQDVIVDDIYLLSNDIEEEKYDVIDLRDFIFGADNGGLMVILPNDEIIRVPYIFPYVNLFTRASINKEECKEFSLRILSLNKSFYESINQIILLKDLNHNYQKLFKYIGFNNNDNIIDIINWHIKKII